MLDQLARIPGALHRLGPSVGLHHVLAGLVAVGLVVTALFFVPPLTPLLAWAMFIASIFFALASFDAHFLARMWVAIFFLFTFSFLGGFSIGRFVLVLPLLLTAVAVSRGRPFSFGVASVLAALLGWLAASFVLFGVVPLALSMLALFVFANMVLIALRLVAP